jgi:aminoglycoside phosphotransferase (APT) family kinase protein
VSSPPIPTRLEHVTPDWLSAFLAVRNPGVQVDDIEILQHTQGAATRLRLRVRYADGGRVGLPEVLFLKTSLTRRMLVADPHMYLTEVRFYDRIRPTVDCETPAVYACDVDEETNRFAAVIEDVAQRKARFPTAETNLAADELAPLMSTLAALHASNWDRPDLESTFNWLETSTRGRSADWWLGAGGRETFEFELAEPYKAAAVDPDRHPVERLYRAFGRLQEANDEGPRTVLHGDTHIGNCYQLPDGTFGLLDWQLMRVANWANDVAYAIVTGLDVETRRAGERDLLRHYLAELAGHGVAAPSWDEAWTRYRQQMVWGIVTWTVTPTAMYTQDLLDRLIRRSVIAADDLDTYAALGV